MTDNLIPFARELTSRFLHNTPGRIGKMTDLTINSEPSKNSYVDRLIVTEWSVTCRVVMKRPSNSDPHMDRTQALKHMVHEIYGPVLQKLYDIRYQLYEIGIDESEMGDLDDLIKNLRGWYD